MNIEKAKNIMRSSDIIEVSYQGRLVWLDDIQSDKMVMAHFIDNQEPILVPVTMLN